jgi:hypothetical protein
MTCHPYGSNIKVNAVDEQGNLHQLLGIIIGKVDPSDGLVYGGGAALLLMFSSP